MIRRITSAVVAEPEPNLWSNCLLVNGIAYIAGLTARGSDFVTIDGANEYAQAKAIFAKMKHLIEAAGGAMADVVKLTIFVTDIRNREQVWRARAEFFSGDFPASTLVEVSALAAPEILVEIEGEAHVGASGNRG